MARLSNMDLMNDCDNFPYYSDSPKAFIGRLSEYYHLKVDGCNATLGYIPSWVAERLPVGTLFQRLEDDEGCKILQMTSGNDPEEVRTKRVAQLLDSLRVDATHRFRVLDGWRNELYPIYGPMKQLLFSMERSATPLFGVVTYGVHMTGFVKTRDGLKIWAPRRAETKQTYPGMMDNTVAGGLSTGEKPSECLVREAMEEASLPANIVQNAKPCGTLTYFHVRDIRAGGEVGLCQPECQYLYDLELPDSVIPKPGDNEAVDFRLLTVSEVQEALARGKFKPNCALVLLDFFVRHGVLTPENEPDYVEIVARLHRKLEFPTV